MSREFDGVAASEGIGLGHAYILNRGVPEVPHESIEKSDVDDEVDRLYHVVDWAKKKINKLEESTEERLGSVEARIFEPQLLMLDDEAFIGEAALYIRNYRLSAAKAINWRILELQALWGRTAHPMVLDPINDLKDLQVRLLCELLGMSDPTDVSDLKDGTIVVAKSLSPSITVQMDPNIVRGIATDEGTRTSHWVILARSLGIPTVCGLGSVLSHAITGQDVIVDGSIGRVVLDPDSHNRKIFKVREIQIEKSEDEIEAVAQLECLTVDEQPVALRANLDLPNEAERAKKYGAQGVGLFRTEFLVVGRNQIPSEDDQYEAYKQVVSTFPKQVVTVRTFDLGGDKLPMFLRMPAEDNPFLGWRAIRVCLDEPDLFRTQIRAILRASAHGDLRIMIPLVNDIEEMGQVRGLVEEEEERLRRQGIPYNSGYKLGLLVETPAAVLEAKELARHSDFFSVGTNDLTQYTLAVDRNNLRLAELFNPFQPAVVKQLAQVSRVGRSTGIEVSVCGEMASDPLGVFLLLGLDITALSVAWPVLPEIKKAVRSFRIEDARKAAKEAIKATKSREVLECLAEGIGDSVDLSVFLERWHLSSRK